MSIMTGGGKQMPYLCMLALTVDASPSSESTVRLSDGHDISSFYHEL